MKSIEKEIFRCPSSHYIDWQRHARELDEKFGFQVDRIEEQYVESAKTLSPKGGVRNWGRLLHDGQQSYVGLSSDQLQTPYHELLLIMESINLPKGSRIMDLGAAYGRLAFVCESFQKEYEFTGIEIAGKRVSDSIEVFKENGLKKSEMLCFNMLNEINSITKADAYFLYDFGNIQDIDIVLRRLKDLSYGEKTLIIARGRGTQSLIWEKHPWLTVFEPFEIGNVFIFSNYLRS